MAKKKFFLSSDHEIKKGLVTDVYFERGVKILKSKGFDKEVKGEVRAYSLPDDWEWAILAGVEEALELLGDKKITLESFPEGTVFKEGQPVMTIEGKYLEFAVFETSLLGFLCHSSGIATKAARCKKAAGPRGVYSFGARRIHPGIVPMIERNAFIGGCDGIAAVESSKFLKEEPVGTMSHSLILVIGNEEETFKAFDEVMDEKINRIALIDTFSDEKFGALKAVDAIGNNLFAVRLDTPKSRRGDFTAILEEVRWELDLRGYRDVKIFVSGGLDEHKIWKFNEYADAYGVGTAISNASVVDFSFDLVEIEGVPVAKRGKKSGSKQVYRCLSCLKDVVLPKTAPPEKCECGKEMIPLLKRFIQKGKTIKKSLPPREIRSYVLAQLEKYNLEP